MEDTSSKPQSKNALLADRGYSTSAAAAEGSRGRRRRDVVADGREGWSGLRSRVAPGYLGISCIPLYVRSVSVSRQQRRRKRVI